MYVYDIFDYVELMMVFMVATNRTNRFIMDTSINVVLFLSFTSICSSDQPHTHAYIFVYVLHSHLQKYHIK